MHIAHSVNQVKDLASELGEHQMFQNYSGGLAPDPAAVFEDGMRLHHIANTAYPIAHHKTIWRYRQDQALHEELMLREFGRKDEPFSLYAHIPFCQTRCAFCEYTVIASPSPQQEADYQRGLLRELGLYTGRLGLQGKRLAGFDIGGGTPALIDPKKIGELVAAVKSSFILEPGFGMSIETTPRIAALHPERMLSYREFGIDRISMGLQLINPALLEAYERAIHEVGFNGPAVRNIRAAGYKEFNIDLMYGFARQSSEDFRRTVLGTIALSPDVITLYRMRYKGTRIAEEAAAVEYARVHEMYEVARAELAAHGFHANPGKNTFTKDPNRPGTSVYLTRRVVEGLPYLGLGLGAQTFTGRVLAYNQGAASKKLDGYLAAVNGGQLPIQDLYDLPPEEGMAKMLAVSFYFGEIDLAGFRSRFGMSVEEAFPDEVEYVRRHELMDYAPQGKLRLTEKGAACFPGVVALFYSETVKRHLHELS